MFCYQSDFPAHSFLVIYSTQNPKDTCQSSQQSGEPRNYNFSKNKIFSNINLHPHLMHMTSAVAKTKQQSHQMALKIETSPRKIFFNREVSTLGSDKKHPLLVDQIKCQNTGKEVWSTLREMFDSPKPPLQQEKLKSTYKKYQTLSTPEKTTSKKRTSPPA